MLLRGHIASSSPVQKVGEITNNTMVDTFLLPKFLDWNISQHFPEFFTGLQGKCELLKSKRFHMNNWKTM